MSQQSGVEVPQASGDHSHIDANLGNARNRNPQNRPVIHDEEERPVAQRPNSALFEMALTPLRWLFQTHPISLNRELDTRKFLGEFDRKYSSRHPTFVDGSYQSAVARAFQQSKFLLIYLHSPMHDDTTKFCNQVLCSESFSVFANQNVVCWAGKIWDPEAYDLSSQLRASSYPFLALLVCQSDRVVQVADRIQGKIKALHYMPQILDNFSVTIMLPLSRILLLPLRGIICFFVFCCFFQIIISNEDHSPCFIFDIISISSSSTLLFSLFLYLTFVLCIITIQQHLFLCNLFLKNHILVFQ